MAALPSSWDGPSLIGYRETFNFRRLPPPSSQRNLNVLVFCPNVPVFDLKYYVAHMLSSQPNINVMTVLDEPKNYQDLATSNTVLMFLNDAHFRRYDAASMVRVKASNLCQWADLLVLAPMDVEDLSGMLHGRVENLMQEILRGWDVGKKILMVPGMSSLMWENPMTKKQLSKLRRKWTWIKVMEPLLWNWNDDEPHDKASVASWDCLDELKEALRLQVDLRAIGKDLTAVGISRLRRSTTTLPPELWSMILDYTGDWELAKALGVYTKLPTPPEWDRSPRPDPGKAPVQELEWALLTGTFNEVKDVFEKVGPFKWLSRLCVRLIMRFALVDVLRYLEVNHAGLFLSTFGHTFLPDQAPVFGQVAILDFWKNSASFAIKEYTTEAMDSASKSSFVEILDWWRTSGLPLKYSEVALEQASAKGHIAVLEWWKAASANEGERHNKRRRTSSSNSRSATPVQLSAETLPSAPSDTASPSSDSSGVIRLKVGKSICYAAQNGHASAVLWWDTSGIAYTHEDAVAKLASTYGHVNVLALWCERKGEKMIYDNQILVGPTRNGHAKVLEWWKSSGCRVEYKTCDIEEALEDVPEGQGAREVREWWLANGLNLGLGTSDWMKTKVLC